MVSETAGPRRGTSDMTDRVVSEEIIRLAVEACPSGMIMTEASGEIVLVNAEIERLFGYHRDELLGRAIDILVPRTLRTLHRVHRAGFVENPIARRMGVGRNLFGVRKDGSMVPVEIGLNPIRSDGRLMILSAITDITERKLAEDRFRLVVEASPSGMIMTDVDGKITLVNAEVLRLFGYEREELIGKTIDMLVPPRIRDQHKHFRAAFHARPEARSMGIGRDLTIARKDGKELPVEIGLNPIQTPEGVMVLSAIIDISERKRAEATLRQYAERERWFIAAAESSNDAIITTTLDGVITGWNPAAARLYGYSTQEMISADIDVIAPDRLRDDVRANLERIGRGEKVDHYETVRVRKDGRRIDVALSLSPIKAEDGTIVGAVKVERDITTQKLAQQALADRTEALQRSNADLEQFAYVASHDLQEPLRMVASYTQLLSEHFKDKLDDKAEKYINYAVDGAKRMQQLIKGLLAFSRVDSQGKMPALIESEIVVQHALDSLKIAIDESRAEIFRDRLPRVLADGVQLEQVFQNLVGNALKFRGSGAPRIRIAAEQQNGACIFRVEDNGIGIDEQYSERVFQMFQRLHERGRYEGSGIGLCISKKIVERHGGRIWFESEPEKGTTFYFTIPNKREGDVR